MGFTNLSWWRRIVGIKSVCACPTPCIATNTVSIENFLRRRHHLIDGVPTSVSSVGVAAQLHSLYFR
ncbi:hypothetical protein BB737_06655 [Mycobacterium avium subsp. hominissuis]|nr:hypothetical protein BB736_20120 [Mycobacterium avium subsp. hominissuis]PBJ66620.1 hypothetical protein BB737_06655 [Mycobacterium avium subsp. hominissuis]